MRSILHYESHHQKWMRDRRKRKSLKLIEGMQKLMIVVETMHKEDLADDNDLIAFLKIIVGQDLESRPEGRDLEAT